MSWGTIEQMCEFGTEAELSLVPTLGKYLSLVGRL